MGRELGLGIGLCSYFMYKTFKVNACGSTQALSIQVMSRADMGTTVYGCIFMSLPVREREMLKLSISEPELTHSGKQHC